MTVELHLGDCLEVMRGMADKSVDAVITDPPYSTPVAVAFGREKVRRLSDLCIQESYIGFLKKELERILKPNGRVCFCCDDTYFPVLFVQFYDWHNTGVVVWDKGRIGMGNPFRKQHELILFATRGMFIPEKQNVPSVIKCAPVPVESRNHGAEKPVGLLTELMRGISLEGDTVFDPFMGSGTTGVACVQTGRNFVGIEIDPTYYAIAERRIAEAQMQPRLTEAE
jgi:site-specific DNA-methyltransferase (adenine-specific)